MYNIHWDDSFKSLTATLGRTDFGSVSKAASLSRQLKKACISRRAHTTIEFDLGER